MSSSAFTSLVAPVSALQAEYLYTAQEVAESQGLTAARWQVLSAAAAAPSSVADVARGLGLARQSVQRVADDLVAAELATWATNPKHARAKLLLPSQRGFDVLAASARRQADWAADVGQRLTAAGVDDAAVAQAVGVLDQVVQASQDYWDAQAD